MIKKTMLIILQIVVALVTLPAVALATLYIENRDNDGPSVIFPGGELVSGELYRGPEPDWSFTDEVGTVHLQLENPLSSRLTWIEESDGKHFERNPGKNLNCLKHMKSCQSELQKNKQKTLLRSCLGSVFHFKSIWIGPGAQHIDFGSSFE